MRFKNIILKIYVFTSRYEFFTSSRINKHSFSNHVNNLTISPYDIVCDSQNISSIKKKNDRLRAVNWQKKQKKFEETQDFKETLPNSPENQISDSITVDIGSTGEFLLIEGAKSLILARELGLKEVPVKVRNRHPK